MKGCLEPYGIYGDGIKRIEFYKDRCIFDLDCFLMDFFDKRDREMGKPDFERYEKKGNVTEYRFLMSDIIEAFLGRYSPEEFAGFLEQLLTDETLQSEALTEKIRRSYEDYKIAIPVYKHAMRICPANFPVEEAVESIPGSCFTKEKLASKTKDRIRWNLYGEEREFSATPPVEYRKLKKIKKAFSDEFKGQILLINNELGPELHPISIISYYNLPTEGLKVIRE